MRYHYEKPTKYTQMYGQKHCCDHPIYNTCTLFTIGNKGLAVIQQRFDEHSKTTRWGAIDPWLNDLLYLHPRFKQFFDERADVPEVDVFKTNYIYPTVTIRQIMWGLKIKPLPRERWETCFDRRVI